MIAKLFGMGQCQVEWIRVTIWIRISNSTYEITRQRWQSGTDLVAEETARDVDLLAANNGNLLTREDLFCNDACKATQEMALAVYDDWRRGESGHFEAEILGNVCTPSSSNKSDFFRFKG